MGRGKTDSVSSMAPMYAYPALLTRTSTRPKAAKALAAYSFMSDWGRERSNWRTLTESTLRLSGTLEGVRTAAMTRSPSLTALRASSRPKPVLAPVMCQTRVILSMRCRDMSK